MASVHQVICKQFQLRSTLQWQSRALQKYIAYGSAH